MYTLLCFIQKLVKHRIVLNSYVLWGKLDVDFRDTNIVLWLFFCYKWGDSLSRICLFRKVRRITSAVKTCLFSCEKDIWSEHSHLKVWKWFPFSPDLFKCQKMTSARGCFCTVSASASLCVHFGKWGLEQIYSILSKMSLENVVSTGVYILPDLNRFYVSCR